MKKRAQIPDAHTYTIIFRGCSQSNHPKQALGKVMAIYQSMLLDKSPVKANIIHINAVLKMCAVAADIDCMLSIVAGLPSEGIQAADHVTFAIVLNALRYHALSRLPTPLSPEQLRQKTRAMILQAQQIWREVIKRWRNGNIWIDEELVCSMGRILLASQEKTHWDEILSLVEQTMAIPRQLPCFGPAWHSENIAQTQIGPQTTSAGDIPTYYAITNNLLPENSSSSSIISHESNNQSLSTIPGASAYAKPGQNTLSLVLDASFLLSSKETAKKYWNMLTQEYHVTPDLDNYMAYLRILRVCRASSDAVHLLGSMPQEKMAAKVFRIAMSSCVRDKNNHHSFSNSGKILDMMQRSLKTPDVKTMMRYLHLAMCPPSNTHKNPPSSKLLLSDKYLGSQILRALDRVYELLLNLKSIIFFKDPALDKQSDRHEFLVDLEMLVARLITAHLRLIKYRMVPSELIPELRMRRGELSNLKRRLYRYKKSIGASNKETIKDSAGDEINTFEDINSRCPSDLISGKNLMTTKDLN